MRPRQVEGSRFRLGEAAPAVFFGKTDEPAWPSGYGNAFRSDGAMLPDTILREAAKAA